MMKSLRNQILLSVGIIIFIVDGISTLVHIRDLQRDYLEAIEWRSEALAQRISNVVEENFAFSDSVQSLLESLSIECKKLYDSNKEKNVTHVAIIDTSGKIAAHNDRTETKAPIKSQILLDYLKQQTLMTKLDGTLYHTLVPLFSPKNEYLGSVDIGMPKKIIDTKVRQMVINSAILFGLFILTAIFTNSVLMHILLTKPVRELVRLGQQLAEGNFVKNTLESSRRDEIGLIGGVFNRISDYLKNISEVASGIATGVLVGEVQIRSNYDVLGKAVHEMLAYLNHITTVMAGIAEGDLTSSVQARSASDAFGQVILRMTEGLRNLIIQIRTSAEEISSIGKIISALSAHDVQIVQDVNLAMERVMSTMLEVGSSVEEVAHNMGTLSTSVEETTASVSLMASSIAQIASNTTDLTNQTHQTIASLDETIMSLEKVVESTDSSKSLSQETIQDALEGQQAVEQVRSSMETIQQTITTAVGAMTRFAERSRDIDTILNVIREITDQTTLLALNASIIAAQAGEHGRGFAVVAGEIKSLADGVGSSTKDIADIVKSLQQETDSVVQTVHEGAVKVKQGMERTHQAQDALQHILTSAQRSSAVVTEIADTLHGLMETSRNVSSAMDRVNTMADDITRATNEQKSSTENINTAVTHINDMASQIQKATNQQLTGVQQVINSANEVTNLIVQNLDSSLQITNTTKQLASQAEVLLQSVDRFKLQTGDRPVAIAEKNEPVDQTTEDFVTESFFEQ